jgi:hypothetical protein
MAVIQHHCKTTIFIGLMVKVGIIWLCMSFYGRLQYKIKDDLNAFYNPIKISCNKNNSISEMRTAFLKKLNYCLGVLSKFFDVSTCDPNNPSCQTLMNQQSQITKSLPL